jgi:hypothetical protein
LQTGSQPWRITCAGSLIVDTNSKHSSGFTGGFDNFQASGRRFDTARVICNMGCSGERQEMRDPRYAACILFPRSPAEIINDVDRYRFQEMT